MMDRIDLTDKGMTVDKAYRDQREKGCYEFVLEKYKDPATVYSWMVLENRIIASVMTKLDCFRHLQDLRRITEDDEFKYTYDLNKCRAILNFAALCPDVSTGKPLPLMLWQQSILCKVQGWRQPSGEKRYTRFIMSVARTNGKTYVTNILMVYAYLVEADGKYNQDLGYIAPVTAQSKKGYGYLQTTFNSLSEINAFKKEFKKKDIRPLDDVVKSPKNQNKLMRLSHESGKLDSFHFLFLVSDEAGDDKSIAKIKENNGKVTSGQIQTDNHQFGQISTAYPDSNSYLYQDERLLEETMKRDYERLLDDYLCMVWEQDNLKETNNPATWIKSNPMLGLNEKKRKAMITSLTSERDTFMAQGKLPEFQNKNLNMWLQVKQNTYLELDDITKSGIDECPFDVKGHKAYIGFDKSNFSDDTALVFMFPYTNSKGKNKMHIIQHSWIPLARSQNNIVIKERQDNVNYRESEERGFATIAKNDYGFIDDDAIFHWLMDYVTDNELKVLFFNYDAWNTSTFVMQIDQLTDWPTQPVRQGTKSLNEPTTDFRKQLMLGNITYDRKDTLIQYSLKNAILLVDNNGVKVDKDKATTKIDIVDAIIDAHFMGMYHFSDVNPNYDDKDKSPFAGMSNEEINDHFKNNFSF